MKFVRWLRCLFGHDWVVTKEVKVQGAGFTDDPGDFAQGGVDYYLRCRRCPKHKIVSKRGRWIAPDYPREIIQ